MLHKLRFFDNLKLIKIYLRSSMVQIQLTSLARLKSKTICSNIDWENCIDLFAVITAEKLISKSITITIINKIDCIFR